MSTTSSPPPSSSDHDDELESTVEEPTTRTHVTPAHAGLLTMDQYVPHVNVQTVERDSPQRSIVDPDKPDDHARRVIQNSQLTNGRIGPYQDPFASSRTSRSSTQGSEFSTTESVDVAEGRKKATEKTPLMRSTESQNKQYSREQNGANNAKGRQPPAQTPPPQSKLTDTPLGQTVASIQSIHPGRGRDLNAPPPAQQQRQQPPPQQQQQQQPPGTCEKIIRKFRILFLFLSIAIVLGGIIAVALWPTLISKEQLLKSKDTGLPFKGLVKIKPSETLTQGGVTVKLNISSVPEPDKLIVKAYYGPTPEESKYYRNNTSYPYLPVVGNYTDRFHFLKPFIYNMGNVSGSLKVTVNIHKGADVTAYMYIFSKYSTAKHFHEDVQDCNATNPETCLCSIETDENRKVEYTYNASMDQCGVPTSEFDLHRYFVLKLENEDESIGYINASLDFEVHTFGMLDLTEFNGMKNKYCSKPVKECIECYHPYGPFFSEVSSHNYMFVSTHYNGTKSDGETYYNTALGLKITESIRLDFIGFLVGVPCAILLLAVVSYTYKYLPKLMGCLGTCIVNTCGCIYPKVKAGYRVLS